MKNRNITMLWGVEFLLLVLIVSHYLLSTSSIEIFSLCKLLGFTLTIPLIFFYHSKDSNSIAITLIVLLCLFAVTPFFVPIKYLYYLYIIYILFKLIQSKSFTLPKNVTQIQLLCFLLLITFNLCTNWIGNFNYLDILTRGWVHLDSIWLTTISAMYKNYKVSTLGIDGLVPITYHTFLHKVYAGISIISDLRSIEIFSLFHPIISTNSFFILSYFVIKSFNKNANTHTFFYFLVLFFVLYYFFPFRTVNITLDFFLSESMFLGTILMLMSIRLLNNYLRESNILSFILFFITSLIILPTKSNVAFINTCILGCVFLTKRNDYKLLFSLIVLLLLTYTTIKSMAISGDNINKTSRNFAATILNYESLMPKVGITIHWIRIIYFFIVFYSPVALYYYLHYKTFKRLEFKNNLVLLSITITCIISLFFNFFYSIGFNTFYFTGPVILLSLIGISTLITFKPITFKFQVAIVSFIALYCVADLIRMGHPSNCNNYIYNRLSNDHKNYKSKELVERLMAVKPGKDVVVHYNVDSLNIGDFGRDAIPFIVSALTESVTVGHVPKYDFYGNGDYRKPYKVILPKNYKIINLNNPATIKNNQTIN